MQSPFQATTTLSKQLRKRSLENKSVLRQARLASSDSGWENTNDLPHVVSLMVIIFRAEVLCCFSLHPDYGKRDSTLAGTRACVGG